MPSNLPKFTMRLDRNTLEKLRYISEFNFRTVNKELEMLVNRHIQEFEKEHGVIKISEE